MALSRTKAFIMLVTPSSITIHVHAPGPRQHLLSRWQLFAFSSGSKTMVYSNGIIRVLPLYIFWVYFIIGYNIVFLNIVSLNLDFNTSGKIWPKIFSIVDSSIYYTLIIQFLPKTLWCGMYFTFTVACVVHYISIWQRGKILSDNWEKCVTIHGIRISILSLLFLLLIYIFKIRYINTGKSIPHGLY